MIPERVKFHHLGLATTDPVRACSFLSSLGYTVGETVLDEIQNVRVVMCTQAHAPDVEVISPAVTPGPLDGILTQNRQLIYHICYATPSIPAALDALAEKKVRPTCVSEPKPAVMFGNRRVSFYMIRGFGLIEFLETELE